MEILKRIPKRYRDPVLWACLKIFHPIFFRLNTLGGGVGGVVKAFAADLLRLNTLRGAKPTLWCLLRYDDHARTFYLEVPPGVAKKTQSNQIQSDTRGPMSKHTLPFLETLISMYDFGPVKLAGLLRNGPPMSSSQQIIHNTTNNPQIIHESQASKFRDINYAKKNKILLLSIAFYFFFQRRSLSEDIRNCKHWKFKTTDDPHFADINVKLSNTVREGLVYWFVWKLKCDNYFRFKTLKNYLQGLKCAKPSGYLKLSTFVKSLLFMKSVEMQKFGHFRGTPVFSNLLAIILLIFRKP